MRYQGTKRQLLAKLRAVSAALSGRGPDMHNVGRSLAIALGYTMLANINEAYIIKARGGTDAMGVKWPPLKPETVAARPLGPGDKKPRGGGRRPTLSRAQDKRWRTIYARMLPRFVTSDGYKEGRKHAAAYAWTVLKSEGATTKKETLGNRPHEIMRDRGILLNSLTPGGLAGTQDLPTGYTAPSSEGGSNQIFVAVPGKVVVGSNDKRTKWLDEGTKHIPPRKIFPKSMQEIPRVWWEDLEDTTHRVATAAIKAVLG